MGEKGAFIFFLFLPRFFPPLLTVTSLLRSLQTPEQHAILVLAVEAGHEAPQLFWNFSFLFLVRSVCL